MSGPSRGGIFISYRREEYSGMAGQLHEWLDVAGTGAPDNE
jgi:hypothetical protein